MLEIHGVADHVPPWRDRHGQERVLRPGLILHCGVETHREACEGTAVVDDYVRIVLVLEGAVDLQYGTSSLRLQVPAGLRGKAVQNAAMVTMQEPVSLRRVVRQGDFARRISIGMARSWMDETLGSNREPSATSASRHLETLFWTVSPRARMLAEQMLNPPELLPGLANLYQESRTIELIIEALSAQAGVNRQVDAAVARTGGEGRLSPVAYARMCDLKLWLQQHAAEPLNLEQIALQMHTTPSTLQRHFRLVHGTTVFDFLLRERLSQARQALERDGVSVEHAAALAGYANATGFATAFRRLFGFAPSQAKLRR